MLFEPTDDQIYGFVVSDGKTIINKGTDAERVIDWTHYKQNLALFIANPQNAELTIGACLEVSGNERARLERRLREVKAENKALLVAANSGDEPLMTRQDYIDLLEDGAISEDERQFALWA